MKKLFLSILTIILISIFVPMYAYAANGDIIGKIYSTDILAVVSGNEVPSYNIGGRTVIIVEKGEEDYSYNGMYYNYEDSERTLRVYGDTADPNGVSLERGRVGEITGDVYASDIEVYFNDIPVKGYNIGGRTAVCIEDIGDPDDSPNASYGYSKYCARSTWDEGSRTIYLDYAKDIPSKSFYAMNNVISQYVFEDDDNVITVKYDNMNPVGIDYYGHYSEAFKNEPYIIKPLYMKLDGQTEQIGICYFRKNDDVEILEKKLFDIDSTAKKLNDYRHQHAERITHDDALKKFNDGVNYETITSAETEDYTLLAVRRLDLEKRYEKYQMSYISVKKTGGYTVIATTNEYDKVSFVKSGINAVDVSVYPFGGPHGATTMTSTYNLDWDIYN